MGLIFSMMWENIDVGKHRRGTSFIVYFPIHVP